MWIKLKTITYHKLGLKDEIETNQNFIKGPMTKIENKNKKN
jgi:hypothetical protein